MATFLKPKDSTYDLPAINDPADLFKYIAEYNSFQYYETDNTGVTPNEIKPAYGFIDRIDQFAPLLNEDRGLFTGVLFIGMPANIGTDVNEATYNAGQFVDIVKPLLNKEFATELARYISCDFQITINSLRPLYNSVKYSKSTNMTGVEVAYQIWI